MTMMLVAPEEARALLAAIRVGETMRVKFPDEWRRAGISYDHQALAMAAAHLASQLDADFEEHACTHCGLEPSRRSNGLCEPCAAYLRGRGHLPGEGTLAKRTHRLRGENTRQHVTEIPMDPVLLDTWNSLELLTVDR